MAKIVKPLACDIRLLYKAALSVDFGFKAFDKLIE